MNNNSDYFVVQGLAGAKNLHGSIEVNGSKNAALPAMASALLFSDKLTLTNTPDIEDVKRMSELLSGLGIKVDASQKSSLSIDCHNINNSALEKNLSKRLRASIILAGPILARMGEVSFPHPGGCVIGARPIDLFIDGFEKMGASVSFKNETYTLKAKDKKLKGTNLVFKIQSVTATETFMLAAALAEGKTVLWNAATEPEIESVAEFLAENGVKIDGIGTTTLTIWGTGGALIKASKNNYEVIPDRIEAGSFLILGAIAASLLKIEKCNPDHLTVPIEILRQAGAQIETGKNSITIKAVPPNVCQSISAKTHEYPGFSTDLQAPLTVFMSQCCGEGTIFETIFEGRLNYITDLVKMGADIKMWDSHHITIKGPSALKGRELSGPDIRAGIAFIMAAIAADGESTIRNAYFIDRGYERIEERLKKIGANIKRLSA